MKFRTLILASLIALIFSACAGPATNMDVDGSSGAGGESGSIGDLIGGLGGDIDDGGDESEPDDSDDSTPTTCTDPNAETKGGVCVCKDGYSEVDGSCEVKKDAPEDNDEEENPNDEDNDGDTELGDPPVDERKCTGSNEEFSENGCVCKEGYGRSSEGKCISLAVIAHLDPVTSAKIVTESAEKGAHTDMTVPTTEFKVILQIDRKRAYKDKSIVHFLLEKKNSDEREECKGSWEDTSKKIAVFTCALNGSTPLEKIDAFVLKHDDVKSKPWFLEKITIKGRTSKREEFKTLYYNPRLTILLDDGDGDRLIRFTPNDIVFHTSFRTDKDTSKNLAYLDINLGSGSQGWNSSQLQEKGGFYLSKIGGGLEFYLELGWDESKNDDFAELESGVDDFRLESVNLRMKKEEDASDKDTWTPTYIELIAFKPSRIRGVRELGERTCWFVSESLISESGEPTTKLGYSRDGNPTDSDFVSGAFFPKAEDCSKCFDELNNENRMDAINQFHFLKCLAHLE